MVPDNIKVIEAEYEGIPTYLIAMVDSSGKPIKALKWIMDGKAVWTDRIQWAWHQPSRPLVEETLLLNFDPDYLNSLNKEREDKERERLISLLKVGF